jgi:protein-tyrosine phosphatase
LRENKITHVVVCAGELSDVFPTDFTYLKLDGLTDNTTTSLASHLLRALPWIDDAVTNAGRVLVHCAAGSSRSGAVLVAYLMWSHHMSVESALAYVRKNRPIINPNPGFMTQLQEFERQGFALNSLR